jgi:hypothetical protein
MGQVFSEYFDFPCQFSFYRLLQMQHHLSSGACTIGQLVGDVPSGLSLIPPQGTKKERLFTVISRAKIILINLKLTLQRTIEIKLNQRRLLV